MILDPKKIIILLAVFIILYVLIKEFQKTYIYPKMHWDCIYILNLDRMKHKYKEVLERLDKLGITKLNTNIIRWKGFDGSTKLPFSKDIYKTDDFNKKKQFLTKMNTTLEENNVVSKKRINDFKPGQIGVYLSFIQIIEHAKQNKYKKILVLEDDVFFVSDFIKQYEEVNDMKQDIIFLGTSHKYWNKKNKTDKNVRWYCPEKIINDKQVEYPKGCLHSTNPKLNNSFLGTFGYVLNQSAYSKILKEAIPMRYAFDVFIGKLFNEKKITVAFLKNPIIYVDFNDTRTSHTGSLQLDGSENKVLL